MVSVDGFHKPGAPWGCPSVEHCGVISSYILQRQRALVLSGCVGREAAENDDSDGNQHCREHPYSRVAVEVFHKWRLLAFSVGVKDKSRLLRLK